MNGTPNSDRCAVNTSSGYSEFLAPGAWRLAAAIPFLCPTRSQTMSFRLADAIFWVAVACCSIAQLAILRSVLISPARVAEPARSTSRARRLAEFAWAGLPGVALALLFVFTWRAMHDIASASVLARLVP